MYEFYLLSHTNPDRSTPDILSTHSAAFPEGRPTYFNSFRAATYCVAVPPSSHTSTPVVLSAVILQYSTVIFPCLALGSLVKSNLRRRAYISACITVSSYMRLLQRAPLMGVTEVKASLSIDMSL